MLAAKPDTKAIEKLENEVVTLQNRRYSVTLDYRNKTRSVLTDEQLKTYPYAFMGPGLCPYYGGGTGPGYGGMMGGYPGAVNRYLYKRGTDVLERMKRSELVGDIVELSGKSETLQLRQQDFVQMLGPDKNKLIVIYCGFVKCTRSHNGATWAVNHGYTNVYRYPGGIFAWKGAKYPTADVK